MRKIFSNFVCFSERPSIIHIVLLPIVLIGFYFSIFQHMVQTGMTTPYTAFAQQNGAAGDTTPLKPDMKAVEGGPPGGGGGGGSPNGVTAQQALQALSAQHANGVVDQQQNVTV